MVTLKNVLLCKKNMNRLTKNFIKTFEINLLRIFSKIFGRGVYVSYKTLKLLSLKYGQYHSANAFESVNSEGSPCPWYTYPAIEYLNNLDFENTSVFEYGCGNSSLYYLERGAKVFSVEDNKIWYEKIKSLSKSNHYIKFASNKTDYIQNFKDLIISNIIVIDGSFRQECAEYLVSKVIPNSVKLSLIIIDNSDRYPNTLSYIDEKIKWHRVDFCGFGPINPYTWVTSIYLCPNNILSRKSRSIHSINEETHFVESID